jgi:hypothetical protein
VTWAQIMMDSSFRWSDEVAGAGHSSATHHSRSSSRRTPGSSAAHWVGVDPVCIDGPGVTRGVAKIKMDSSFRWNDEG